MNVAFFLSHVETRNKKYYQASGGYSIIIIVYYIYVCVYINFI